MVELGAKKMVDAFDHVVDDFFGGVPDAEFLAQVGVEGFEEGLVEVGDRFFFAEDFEECGLHAVESFSGEIENLLKLDGIQRSGIGHLAEEFAQNGNAKVVSGDAPVECVRRAHGIRGYDARESRRRKFRKRGSGREWSGRSARLSRLRTGCRAIPEERL